MSENSKYQAKDLVQLLNEYLESISSDETSARQYLSEQGKNPDEVVQKGLKRIRKMQLQIDAQRTKEEMISSEKYKDEAEEWVNKILADAAFSFHEYVKTEQLAINFRNIESLSKEDIKEILLKHILLKLMKKNSGAGNGV